MTIPLPGLHAPGLNVAIEAEVVRLIVGPRGNRQVKISAEKGKGGRASACRIRFLASDTGMLLMTMAAIADGIIRQGGPIHPAGAVPMGGIGICTGQ